MIHDKKHIQILNSNDELFNNKFNSDTGVVVIECNRLNKPGTISYVNQAFLKMNGFNKKEELIGNNISMLQPNIVGNVHDQIIIKFFDKGKTNYLKKSLSTLCLKNKDNYLLPIHLLIAIMPSFGNSLEGIGLIRRRQKLDEIIISDYYGRIDSMTEQAYAEIQPYAGYD